VLQLVLLANESDGEDEDQAGERAEQEGEQIEAGAEGGQAQPEQGQPVMELEEFDKNELEDLFAALQGGR